MMRPHSQAQQRAVMQFVEWSRRSLPFESVDRLSKALRQYLAEQRRMRPPKERKSVMPGGYAKIPRKVREALENDPYMKVCIWRWYDPRHVCDGRLEWEHAWMHAGRRIQEAWAIVPICSWFHRGAGLSKRLNRLAALCKAQAEHGSRVNEVLSKAYPGVDWLTIYSSLLSEMPSYRHPTAEDVARLEAHE